MRRRDLLASGLASLSMATLGTRLSLAQDKYPEQPIKLVVPRSAGGVVDVVARIWAEAVKPHLGNMGPRSLLQFGGGHPERLDKVDARLKALGIMMGAK